MIVHLDFDVTITDADPAALERLAFLCEQWDIPTVINTARLPHHCAEIMPRIQDLAPALHAYLLRSNTGLQTVYSRPSYESDVARYKCINMHLAGKHRRLPGGILVDDNPDNVAAARAIGLQSLYTPRGVKMDHVNAIQATLQAMR